MPIMPPDTQQKIITPLISKSVREAAPHFAPASIVVREDTIYIVDEVGHKVWLFSLDLEKKAEYGCYGHDHGEFWYPVSLCFDDEGLIYVADKWNHRVQVFNDQFTFVKQYGSYGTEEGEFNEPVGLAWQGGILYVAERSSGRLQGFNQNGCVVYSFESNAPLHQFYESVSFQSNKHYKRWLANTTRFNSMYDQFNECGFKLGLLEYPENIMVSDDEGLIVIDKVNGVALRFSNELIHEGYVQCNNSLSFDLHAISACCRGDKGGMWFALESQKQVMRVVGSSVDVFKLENVKIGSIAVHDDHLYVADFWGGAIHKYGLEI